MTRSNASRLPQAISLFAGVAASTLALADPAVPPATPVAPPLTAPAEPTTAPARPVVPRVMEAAKVPARALMVEPDGSGGAASLSSPFAPAAARLPNAGSTLTAPVTLNANSSTDALTATQAGGGRALTGIVTGSGNTLSAVKGQTAGSGAGVNGVTSGTGGNAGKFQSTNASNAQPALLATHAGTGSAVSAIVSNTGGFDAPAVLGQHNATSGYGVGVEGDGGYTGLIGHGQYYGVQGLASGGTGVYGSGEKGLYGDGSSYGVYGYGSNYGVYGSGTSYGVSGRGSSTGSFGGYFSGGYTGSYGTGANYGAYGKATGSGVGVYADADAGYGLVARTTSGAYAGVFFGSVYVTANVFAASYMSTSDRAVKQAFHDIDNNDILQRIEAMPIGGWDFQATPGVHHIGPMAQDFRAAFGLGVDDKHIDMTDGLGVSLAAIQALKQQLDEKSARIDALERERAVAQQTSDAARAAMDARLAALEQAVSSGNAMVATRP